MMNAAAQGGMNDPKRRRNILAPRTDKAITEAKVMLSMPKKPFCNPCRRLLMDRMSMFMLFHPHPSVHDTTRQTFASVIRKQYQNERYRVRKMSNEWCECCRDPKIANKPPRTSLDRFNLLWEHRTVQHRIACEWYKDARHVDSQITKLAANLKKYLGTIGDPAVLGLLTEISDLINARDVLKSVQKALARLPKKIRQNQRAPFSHRIEVSVTNFRKARQTGILNVDHMQAVLTAIDSCSAKGATDVLIDGF